jgi:hypothetical protein
MLEEIAFLAIITAAITSTFIARAESERARAEETDEKTLESRLDARFDVIDERFDQIQTMLRALGGS